MVTSSASPAVALKTAPHRWLQGLDLQVMGDDPELLAGKPAPDIYLLAMRRLGVEPTGAWAFEDSVAGSESAMTAGCQVWVLPPEDAERSAYPEGVNWLGSLRQVPWLDNDVELLSTGG